MIADVSAAARLRLAALRARLDRTTRRERLLLGGLAAGAFLYAPIAALDWRDAQQEQYLQSAADRSAARLSLQAARRAVADPTSRAVLDDMESWGFQASNIDIARVLIEQRLWEDVQASGLANARIATDEQAQAIGPTQWLGAEINADLTWSGVFGLLDRIGTWPEGYQVTGFSYRLPPMQMNPELGRQPGAGQVTIGLSFPVATPDPAEAA